MDRQMNFDEVVTLAATAAMRSGSYPQDLAGLVGEMVLWLERHRLPGLELLANWLETAPAFDTEAAQPIIHPNAPTEFPDPFIGGMFMVDNFEMMTMPAMIKAPEGGAALMAPFFAMAAHKREIPLEIALLGTTTRQGEAARITYRDGKSAFEGKISMMFAADAIGLTKPDFLAKQPVEPIAETIMVKPAVLARLAPPALS